VKVFISWSGEPSRSIARALKLWLPGVAQHVEPWMSEEDIKGGARWHDEVSKALDATEFGIICVTTANRDKPWLIFEAGALAKHLASARVVPLCVDLKPAAITGPLSAFQGRELDKDGIGRMVLELMALREPPVPEGQVAAVFEAMWPLLKADVAAAKEKAPEPETPQRSTEEMLEEIVERVRRLDRSQNGGAPGRKITIRGDAREATEEEQAAVDRQRAATGSGRLLFPRSSESDDI
jgi:hypothetical protein